MGEQPTYVRWFDDLDSGDNAVAGGKNASLGEMIGALKDEGIRVPDGFATTADAYWAFVDEAGIKDDIEKALKAYHEGDRDLEETGRAIRGMFTNADFPDDIADPIREAYAELCDRTEKEEVDVAVRSSATAEDLPEASFAGQQETFLNVRGADEVLEACRRCYASLFTDRAISYREENDFDHMKIALSAGIQRMVRAGRGGSGVMFTIDTETGFPDVVVINAVWGLGENVVQGTVNPDEYRVFKPRLEGENLRPIIGKSLGEKEKKMVYAKGGSRTTRNVDTPRKQRQAYVLGDDEILDLARWAAAIERHYDKPMDIEWARDGETEELFIVQARPETIQSRKQADALKTYRLQEKGEQRVEGLAIGQAIASGKVLVIRDAEEIDRFEEGAILVTESTDPDWVPIMKQAAGIVTDYGGRTSHAAIVSRELGVPAVVGAGDATDTLEDGDEVTISCAGGEEGVVYEGKLPFDVEEVDLSEVPETDTKVMMNIASPQAAFRWWRLPCEGIGLARMEFVIGNTIQVHPLALVHYDDLDDEEAVSRIAALTHGYQDKPQYFVDRLAEGIATIAASQYPDDVIVRMSDFKTNEYADLIGGAAFEPDEENPMLGWRGASRYASEDYREGFALECRAIRKVRETMGLDNVVVMVPFCRTPEEADGVLKTMAEHGLERGSKGLRVYVMAEIPSNVLLAEAFAERVDGFSIGTNDLTQLVLGVDRDSTRLEALFDERNEAVKKMVKQLIDAAHEADTPVGLCGQAPSDHPDFAKFLVQSGIDSISLNPDSVIRVKRKVAEEENRK